MIYTVCTPLCPIYKEPDVTSEYADEAFYGQKAEVLEEKDGFYLIHTDYDYKGWSPVGCLSDAEYTPTHVVTSAFGDMLWEPKNCRRAALDLPRGSRVMVLEEGGTERYAAVKTIDGKVFYLHRKNLVTVDCLGRERDEATLRRDITDTARLFLGTGYRWGGKTAEGLDCSGLAFMSYYMNGIHVYRDAHVERSPRLRLITIEEAKEGDLLFFPGHVAVYIGDGLYIHSTTSLGGVGFNSLDPDSPIFNEGLKKSLNAVATAF